MCWKLNVQPLCRLIVVSIARQGHRRFAGFPLDANAAYFQSFAEIQFSRTSANGRLRSEVKWGVHRQGIETSKFGDAIHWCSLLLSHRLGGPLRRGRWLEKALGPW